MGVPFLLLGLWAIRNIGVAAMVTLPIVARAVAADAPRPEQASRVDVVFVVALAMVPVLVTVQAVAEPDYDFTGYPVAAFDTLVEEGRVGQRLYTKDAWAGYSIWRFGTQQPVFMDDRFDMYPLQVQRDYVAIATLDPGGPSASTTTASRSSWSRRPARSARRSPSRRDGVDSRSTTSPSPTCERPEAAEALRIVGPSRFGPEARDDRSAGRPRRRWAAPVGPMR